MPEITGNECPHCHIYLWTLDGTNCDACPKCDRWYLEDPISGELVEVI